MSARDTLTPELRAEVLRLEDDLRARVTSLPDVTQAWREEYDAARAAERTAAAWEAWVDERVTLAAVAWVLTTVFIRFCEDNGLVRPVWISGPRVRDALEAQQQFLRETARVNADVTDREWLLEAVNHLRSLPATAGLVDETSPMWLVSPSGDAMTQLLNFWRERDDSGKLLRDLSDPDLDTRFLGDLYQDISEDAKQRFALLQTPVFVEEFILDRTLEPALNERPLEGFKMIDPTCGSGHFLLGGFQRLLDRWHKRAPGLDERERVQAALDSVYGVDLNPFAVAITRFRLTVAALQSCGLRTLEEAPAFKYHLAAGDSLLHGLDAEELGIGAAFSNDRVAAGFTYATENLNMLASILRNGQYDAVVGNPPYIQPSDEALNQLYRRNFPTVRGKYQLTVPFMEKFFGLAKHAQPAGWVGQITGNGFIKKQFGSSLVEAFLPKKDLRLLIDASGAYIPGHGTPTVILVGTNARPVATQLRAVLGIRAEPSRPVDPAQGQVWSAIAAHVDNPGWEDSWISVVDLERANLATHPWSLSGGGSSVVLNAVETAGRSRVADHAYRVGIFGIMGSDDAMMVTAGVVLRERLEAAAVRRLVVGDEVRDFAVAPGEPTWFPYDADHELQDIEQFPRFAKHLWPMRTELGNRATFSKGTYFTDGRPWYEWHQLPKDLGASSFTIAFAEVATHNHFVLDRVGNVFNRSAPVIKLRESATEDDGLGLLGALNSSVVCFWLRQFCGAKGGSGIGRGIQPEAWMERFNFNSTNVARIPLPAELPVQQARVLDSLAENLARRSPAEVAAEGLPTAERLAEARAQYAAIRGQMIAAQEELDWHTYRLYGLIDEDLVYSGNDLPEVALGERAFEVVLGRSIRDNQGETEWFARHGSAPAGEVPDRWPPAYREVVRRRIKLIASNASIKLLEKPEHKRRWTAEPWEKHEERALREWLLERLETQSFWFDQHGRPAPKSIAALADLVARDDSFAAVLSLWAGRRDVAVVESLEKLLAPEGVPFLAAYRYKEAGLRKYLAWQTTWEMQRREDAGAYKPNAKDLGGDGPIPVPPKYSPADFAKTDFWSHRGKLDVSKERLILYPATGRDGDPTPVVGWAGWDHAQQALAIATLMQAGEQQGWPDERLIPLLAGLAELLPWLEQWHSDPDVLYGGGSPAEFFTGLLDSYMAKVGATRETLSQWRPPAPTRGRKAKS